MSGRRRYCDHCGEYVCKSTYFEHQLAGAYEHVAGSTEVDREFTNDGKASCSTTLSQRSRLSGVICFIHSGMNKPYSSDFEIQNEMSNQCSSNECSSDAETSDREVRGQNACL